MDKTNKIKDEKSPYLQITEETYKSVIKAVEEQMRNQTLAEVEKFLDSEQHSSDENELCNCSICCFIRYVKEEIKKIQSQGADKENRHSAESEIQKGGNPFPDTNTQCLCCKGICDCEYGCEHPHNERELLELANQIIYCEKCQGKVKSDDS